MNESNDTGVLSITRAELEALKAALGPEKQSLAVQAIEELCQLGYTVKEGRLYPPAVTQKLTKAERVHELVNDGPWLGMSESFDKHMGPGSWVDPSYRQDAATWAAAWKAALSLNRTPPRAFRHDKEFNNEGDQIGGDDPSFYRKSSQERSPTADMSIEQRILHVGGRTNAAGYVEFGSVQAVQALVRQVLRDLPPVNPVPAGWFIAETGGGEIIVNAPVGGPGSLTIPADCQGSLPIRLLDALCRDLLSTEPKRDHG